MTELRNIEHAQNIIATISSEWYRLSELTVDSELNDTVPSDLMVLIEELGTQLDHIEQRLEEEYYNLSYNYRINDNDNSIDIDYHRWIE